MQLDFYKKDFDIIPTYTSLVLLFFERLSESHYQAYTLHVMRLRDSKGSMNFLRINFVSLTNLHTQHVPTVPTYTIERNEAA